MLFCIPKILKNESNSQLMNPRGINTKSCFVSQRYWKMKAIHNHNHKPHNHTIVVLYPKDTEKWKQFTTITSILLLHVALFCIPKILKNESNSQRYRLVCISHLSCFVSQRYWKMKAIHNQFCVKLFLKMVVLYPKDTEKWKQFTTSGSRRYPYPLLFCIPKILKNESNSQRKTFPKYSVIGCFVSQRYWKMKAIHNQSQLSDAEHIVVLYPKDTEKWKQFTTPIPALSI